MRKYAFGVITGVVLVLVIQSAPLKEYRDAVSQRIVDVVDTVVDSYVAERDKTISQKGGTN